MRRASGPWVACAVACLLTGRAWGNAGDLDPTFGSAGYVTTPFGAGTDDTANAVTVDGSGRLVVAGRSGTPPSAYDFAVARYTTTGALDTTFSDDGRVTTSIGSGDDRVSDFSDLDRDKGPTPFNQTHTFIFSSVIQPKLSGSGLGALIANNNQLGLIVQANSGLPFNIRSNQDLNLDGITNDRPLGVERNSGRLGTVINVDARYVRFVRLTGRWRAELFAEAKNLLNRGCSDPATYATCDSNVSGVNRIVTTDAQGNPAAALPAVFPGTAGYLQRAFQFGAKLTF